MHQLSLEDGTSTDTKDDAKAIKKPAKPFPFLALPSELRVRVYEYHFAGTHNKVIDLDPSNFKRIWKNLLLLRTCRTVYSEASYFFFSTHTFRVFPTFPGRHFKTKRPLLARLNARQRSLITSLELRLGPGWSKPPRGWVVNPSLGLRDCVNVRKLNVIVQLDPSLSFLQGYRQADGFYESFSRDLLVGLLAGLPHVDRVQFDAWESVRKASPIMQALLSAALESRKTLCWGPERGWTDHDDDSDAPTLPAATLLDGFSPALLVAA